MRSVGPSPGFVFALKTDIAEIIQGQPGRGAVPPSLACKSLAAAFRASRQWGCPAVLRSPRPVTYEAFPIDPGGPLPGAEPVDLTDRMPAAIDAISTAPETTTLDALSSFTSSAQTGRDSPSRHRLVSDGGRRIAGGIPA
eukprot:1335000-Prymnesium_polylepis.1